ncbi:MAG: antibiotic biosynthesis monooxygenase [Alteraurantiacibacter sp.]|nr:antibiotic biosynthesis monooxygenase [Alteraurantiacibacter sp.]
MFIAMNRFQVKPGQESAFEAVWKSRDSYLQGVPGFIAFHLLRGETSDECTLFATHTVWESRDAFVAWTRSEAFRKAHASAGDNRPLYVGSPRLELFEAVQIIEAG